MTECIPCELAAETDATTKVAPWSGPIGIEGQRTGDGRLINLNALRWENLPIPLRYVDEDHGAHDGAVVVGRIDTIERLSYEEANKRLEASGRDPLPETFADTGIVWGTGVYDLGSATGQEAHRLCDKGYMPGISMDLDDVVIEEGEGEDFSILEGRIRAATQVAIPAFDGARIAVDKVAVEQFEQDSEQFNWVEDVGGLPPYIKRISKHLVKKGMTESHAIATAVNVVKKMCATGDVNFPGAQQVNAGSRAEACAAVADWEAKKARAATEDVLVAGAAHVFDASWFKDPHLSGPTPITVTDEGRVFGHIAAWDTCHIANPQGRNVCTRPPRSQTNYAYFQTGAVATTEGEMAVGKITMNTLHAGPRLNNIDAQHHYEHTGATGAFVVAGEDDYGIWVAGAAHPDADLTTLKASPISGDWRTIRGNLELVSALSVNIPGFPVPRPQALVASGQVRSLVASGMMGAPTDRAKAEAMSGDQIIHLFKQFRDMERRERADALAARVNRLAALEKVRRMAAYVQKFEFNPNQWRMPRGNPGAGQWIDMPDVAVDDLAAALESMAESADLNDSEATMLGDEMGRAWDAAKNASDALKAADGDGAQSAAAAADESLSKIEAQLFQHADNGTIDEATASSLGEKLDAARNAVTSIKEADLSFLGEDSDIGSGEEGADIGAVPEGTPEVPLGWSDTWPAGFLEPGDQVIAEEDANGDLVDLKVVRDGIEIDTEGLEAAELDAFLESQGGGETPEANAPQAKENVGGGTKPEDRPQNIEAPGGSAQQQAGNDAESSAGILEQTLQDVANMEDMADAEQVGAALENFQEALAALNAGIQDGNYNAADLARTKNALSQLEAVLMNMADQPGLSDAMANQIGVALDDVFAKVASLESSLQGEMTPPPFAGRSYARQWLGRRGIRLRTTAMR